MKHPPYKFKSSCCAREVPTTLPTSWKHWQEVFTNKSAYLRSEHLCSSRETNLRIATASETIANLKHLAEGKRCEDVAHVHVWRALSTGRAHAALRHHVLAFWRFRIHLIFFRRLFSAFSVTTLKKICTDTVLVSEILHWQRVSVPELSLFKSNARPRREGSLKSSLGAGPIRYVIAMDPCMNN